MMTKQAVIIGGGPAGLSCAVQLHKLGITDILILEREKHLGGILRQCIHDGFGLTRFGESLSGPEYARRFIDLVEDYEIPYMTEAAVTDISPEKIVSVVTREGLLKIQASAVILSMGCRERTRGALGIPGERPYGVMTAGMAQAYMNLYNTMVGHDVIILGSGDIGMIMARRMTLEGCKVHGVFEINPYANGLPRNRQQCLNDFDIPLYLNTTVVDIHGDARITGVTVAEVDDKLRPIPGTEREYPCDTLILSVGLIPENELSLDAGVVLDPATGGAVVDENFMTGVDGIFSAGNVLHVHDLVDFVSMEAERLAMGVRDYLNGRNKPCVNRIVPAGKVSHTVPQRFSAEKDLTLTFRVKEPMKRCRITMRQNGRIVFTKPLQNALPSEMMRIDVKAGIFDKNGDLEVSVE